MELTYHADGTGRQSPSDGERDRERPHDPRRYMPSTMNGALSM